MLSHSHSDHTGGLSALLAFLLGVVYMQESLHAPAEALRMPFIKAFSLLALNPACTQ